MQNKNFFFNGLNELRALAAILVIFHHIELFKNSDHIFSLVNSSYLSYFVTRVGKNGVYLFFVLSGFLITYLLLNEKEKLNTISFKNFYLRRIYRIWPLYYLIIVIGFIIIPLLANTFEIFQNTPYFFSLISTPENYSCKSILLYIFFLPNVALDFFNIVLVGCSQSWSVGVEEQFYIIWPIIVYLFSRKKVLIVFFSLLFFLISIHFIANSFLDFTNRITFLIYKFILVLPFEFMAIGAIGGYFFFYHKAKILFYTKFKFFYFFIISLILGAMFVPFLPIFFQNIILSILFLLLIITTINDENNWAFRNQYLAYIGKISYGVYMYHPFIMFLVFPFVNKYFPFTVNPYLYNSLIYFFIFTFSILLSHFSYKYFESIFINIKDKKYKSL